MPDDFVPQLTVSVNGTELADDVYDRLIAVRAECSVQVPDQITLTFIDEDFELYDRQIAAVGDAVVVSISAGGTPTQVADCDVTAIAVQPGDDGGMTVVVTAHGADHLLYRGVELATYLDQTDSDIASTVASNAGLAADVDSTSIRHPHVMQATTANVFLDELAGHVGFRWWVEGRTLKFKQSMPADDGPTLTWGVDLLSLRVLSTTSDTTPSVTVRSWNPDTQSAVVGTHTPSASLDTIGTDAPGPTAVATGGASLTTIGRFRAAKPTADDSAATEMAKALSSRLAVNAVHVRGSVLGNPAIKAGRTVTIAEAGTRLSGKYRLAKVEHSYTASDGYITHFETGGQDATGLVDLLRGRPEAIAPWHVHGLVVGIVTNISDPERPARVKVKFPTFSDDLESAWARVALPGAGSSRGFQVLPEKDDEVLIGFEHGDPARPVVLGGLWSKQLQPPEANDQAVQSDQVAIRTWKSRAGHSITIRDNASSDADSVIVALADGATKLTIAQDKVVLETPSDLTITTDKKADFTAQGDVTISGNNVTIKATAKLALEGNEVAAKGTTKAGMEGAMVDVKASSKLGLDGGAMTQVKGGMVQLN